MRPFLYLLFGLLFGGFAAYASAQSPVQIPINIPVTGPSSVTLSGAWDAMVPGINEGYQPSDFGAGSGEVYRGAAVRVDGVPAQLTARRRISAGGIARGAASLAKRAGPLGIVGGVLVDAGWSYIEGQWFRPDVESAPDVVTSGDWFDQYDGCVRLTPGQSGVNSFGSAYEIWTVTAQPVSPGAGYQSMNNCTNQPYNDGWPVLWRRSVASPYNPTYDTVPATDADIEGQLTENLVDGDLDPAEALRQSIASGDISDADLEPTSVTGPAYVYGPTVTSTSSGPSGQTTSETQSKYEFGYSPGGVSITKSDTTTTTTPDGQTTTNTTTVTGSAGQTPAKPAEQQKPFCELYPDAMACQPLGSPSPVELPTGTINVPGLSYESVTAACPAPYTFTPAAGGSYEISWQPVCDGAEAVRPVVIVVGLLTAGVFVFVGMRRGQS